MAIMMNRFARQAFTPAVAQVQMPMAWAPPPPATLAPNPPAYVCPDPPAASKTLNAPLALLPTPAWSSNLFAKQTGPNTGQIFEGDKLTTLGAALALAGTGLGAYHGYKRNESIGWAIAWGLLGGIFPIIAIPVAFAQGFGQRK